MNKKSFFTPLLVVLFFFENSLSPAISCATPRYSPTKQRSSLQDLAHAASPRLQRTQKRVFGPDPRPTGNSCKRRRLFQESEDSEDDEETREKNGIEYFVSAARDGNLEYIKKQLTLEKSKTSGSSVINQKDSVEHTALIAATLYGHQKIVNYLLSEYANPDISNSIGMTPLMVAVIFDHPNIALRLLEENINLEKQDWAGRTALDLILTKTQNQRKAFFFIEHALSFRMKNS